jgi:glutathione peroxidase
MRPSEFLVRKLSIALGIAILAMTTAAFAEDEKAPAKEAKQDTDPAKEKEPKKTAEDPTPATPPRSIFAFKVKTIDDEDFSLRELRGHPTLIVNVASQCGLTNSQYKGLEALYRKYKEQGLEIVAFPANNFGRQEPGTNLEIKEFCAKKEVSFRLLAKISVAGEDQHPLYKYLTDEKLQGENGGKIRWNFDKILVDDRGRVIGRFEPKEDPLGAKVTKAVDTAIEKAAERAKRRAARRAAAGGTASGGAAGGGTKKE